MLEISFKFGELILRAGEEPKCLFMLSQGSAIGTLEEKVVTNLKPSPYGRRLIPLLEKFKFHKDENSRNVNQFTFEK